MNDHNDVVSPTLLQKRSDFVCFLIDGEHLALAEAVMEGRQGNLSRSQQDTLRQLASVFETQRQANTAERAENAITLVTTSGWGGEVDAVIQSGWQSF